MKAFEIKNNIFWTGVLDPELRTFDIVMETPYGTTYNSYFINDEKKVLIDTVKPNFKGEYLEKLQNLVDIKDLDIVIINHTEPDHAGSLKYILEINPDLEIYSTKAASIFLKEQLNQDFKSHVIKDGETLNIGSRTLKFITAPFLHWSDTMFVYSEEDRFLFTCDGFGSHYCAVEPEKTEGQDYADAFKTYYDAIMHPFAPHILSALDKIKDLEIEKTLPSHGPILEDGTEQREHYYTWAKRDNDKRNKNQVAVIYLSAYRNTEKMAMGIMEGLQRVKGITIKMIDAEKEPLDEIAETIAVSKGIIIGSPTINKSMVKPLWDMFSTIDPFANMGKIAGVFGSYGWSGEGIKMADSLLRQMGFKVPFEPMEKKFSPSEETIEKCWEFGESFAKKIIE